MREAVAVSALVRAQVRQLFVFAGYWVFSALNTLAVLIGAAYMEGVE